MKFVKVFLIINLIGSIVFLLVIFILYGREQNEYSQYVSLINKKMSMLHKQLNENKNFLESKKLAIYIYTEVNSKINITNYLIKINKCNDINELTQLLDELEYKVLEYVFLKQDELDQKKRFYSKIQMIIIIYSLLSIIFLTLIFLKKNKNYSEIHQ